MCPRLEVSPGLSPDEENDVLDVRGVGKHVDGLDGGNTVVGIEVVQVAGLCGRVARDVDDTLGGCPENGFYHIGMHAGTGRIGDDDIRTTMFGDEIVGKDILHVAGIEKGVGDAVDLGVDLRILDGLWDVLDANHLSGLARHEIGDGAGAGIEVVDNFSALQPRELAGDGVEVISLFGVGLVEGFRAYFETKIFHQFEDMVLALEDEDILIADGVVALLVVEVHQRGDLWELIGDMLQ